MSEKELRRYSRVVVDGVEQAPSRAMLRAVGFSEEDFQRPQIGIASTWSMVTPCNMHIGGLADEAAKGANDAGERILLLLRERGIGFRINKHYALDCKDGTWPDYRTGGREDKVLIRHGVRKLHGAGVRVNVCLERPALEQVDPVVVRFIKVRSEFYIHRILVSGMQDLQHLAQDVQPTLTGLLVMALGLVSTELFVREFPVGDSGRPANWFPGA